MEQITYLYCHHASSHGTAPLEESDFCYGGDTLLYDAPVSFDCENGTSGAIGGSKRINVVYNAVIMQTRSRYEEQPQVAPMHRDTTNCNSFTLSPVNTPFPTSTDKLRCSVSPLRK